MAVAGTVREALEIIRATPPDVVLLDVRLPDMSGLDACSRIHEINGLVPVVIMTAFARTDVAIEATRRGAFDYLIKPLDLRQLRDIVQKAVQVSRLRRVPAIVPSPDQSAAADADLIVGNSPPMQEVYKFIGRVASNDARCADQWGRAVPARSWWRGQYFTTADAVTNRFWRSIVRRYRKPCWRASFLVMSVVLTGAEQRRIGKFEQVNGGTILLDEIGDMSPATQAKALRLLQQQQFERVGGNTTIQTDVRIIAATNAESAGNGRSRTVPSRPVLSSECVHHSVAAAPAKTSGRARADPCVSPDNCPADWAYVSAHYSGSSWLHCSSMTGRGMFASWKVL
ncbi:MAG UNVERIFIED_CONTAM: sigma 54-interacting transcriptional regulator [Planctomycetaceae bacterium]